MEDIKDIKDQLNEINQKLDYIIGFINQEKEMNDKYRNLIFRKLADLDVSIKCK